MPPAATPAAPRRVRAADVRAASSEPDAGAGEAPLTGRSTARGSDGGGGAAVLGLTTRGGASKDSGLTARVIACQSWRADGGIISQSFAATTERITPFASLGRSSSAPLAAHAAATGGLSFSTSRLLGASSASGAGASSSTTGGAAARGSAAASPSIYVKSSSVVGARVAQAQPQVQWKFNQGINRNFTQATKFPEELAQLSKKGARDTVCKQLTTHSLGVDHKMRWNGGPNRYVNGGGLDWTLRLNP